MSAQFPAPRTPPRRRTPGARRSWPPRVRPVLHRPHGHDPLDPGPRLARRRRCGRTGRSPLDPASMVLHYGQEIFEGLKAYRQPDGSIASFRPEANAARFRGSAARLAMAELPDELFLASLAELLDVDREWVPPAGGEESLYLRPFMMATEVGLGVRPSAEYLYLLIASPAGPYFPGGVKPVDVWLSTDYTRAALGGTGTAKCGGNYAASLLPAGPGRRARLRAGGLPRRRGAPLDRRDGLEQPVLRLRLRRPGRGGDALADRQHPARDHPRLAAGAGQGAGLPGHRAADLVAGVAARAPRTGGSPRCSAAARPR